MKMTPPLLLCSLLLPLAALSPALSLSTELASPHQIRCSDAPPRADGALMDGLRTDQNRRPLSLGRPAVANLERSGGDKHVPPGSSCPLRFVAPRDEIEEGDRRIIECGRRSYLSGALAAAAAAAAAFPGLARAAVDATDEPEECRGGAIVAEAAIPGAYQQICMTVPERTISLKSTGDKLSILQGGTSGTSDKGTLTGRTGVAVWNSCLLLTRLLDRLASLSQDSATSLFRGETVLEVGCGTALASIAASKLGAAEVIATDGNPEVVDLARANLERNGVSSSAGRAAELRWGLLDAADFYDAADVVVGSDLTYNPGSWRVLAETLGAVLKPGGYVLYLAMGHSGFNVSGEIGGFLSVVDSEGLELVEESSDRWPFRGGGGGMLSLSKLLEACVAPKEKAAFDATGGARAIVLRKKRNKKLA